MLWRHRVPQVPLGILAATSIYIEITTCCSTPKHVNQQDGMQHCEFNLANEARVILATACFLHLRAASIHVCAVSWNVSIIICFLSFMTGINNCKKHHQKNPKLVLQLDLCESNHMQTRKKGDHRTVKSQMHEANSASKRRKHKIIQTLYMNTDAVSHPKI